MEGESFDTAAQRTVLVYAPASGDISLTTGALERAGIPIRVCTTAGVVADRIRCGAGAVLLTRELQKPADWDTLALAVDEQPPWSDIPVILYAGSARREVSAETLDRLARLGNVTVLSRPIRSSIMISTIRFALRSRARQYELRDVLTALNDANRTKDEFLATLSHELRTPLNAILGWAAMLRNKQVDPDLVTRAYEVIERNANAQRALVEDLLDMSRIIAGKLALSRTTAPVVPLLLAAVETINPVASAKRVEVITEIDAPDATVAGDPGRLQQIFWNLLSNAVKFTPEGGRVEARVFVRAGQVFVTVADSGVGIEPDFLPYVFDRFRQADPSTTRRYNGLGLGLAIVRHLVDRHGGSISAHSEGVGLGSTFRIAFPLARPIDEPVPGEQPLSPAPTADLRGIRVLVVDEEKDSRELVGAMLRSAGASVALVSTSERAKTLLGEEPLPDLVISSDILVSGQDGNSLIDTIRTYPGPRVRALPVVAVTAYAAAEDAERTRLAGFQTVLTKPLEPAQLTATLAQILGRRP